MPINLFTVIKTLQLSNNKIKNQNKLLRKNIYSFLNKQKKATVILSEKCYNNTDLINRIKNNYKINTEEIERNLTKLEEATIQYIINTSKNHRTLENNIKKITKK